MTEGSGLAGRRVLVPEHRELDLFCRMLEEAGATAVRCPLVTILDAEEPALVAAWLKRLTAGDFDDLILLTGEGLRRLVAAAAPLGLEQDVTRAIARLRTITRGPKPVRALREIGLAPGLQAITPTTEGVIDVLRPENLEGRTVGVQLYPGNPLDQLMSFLHEKGAVPEPVLPYRYASDAETSVVADAIRDLAAGKYDLVAFTSSPQVRRLQEVAEENGLERELREGFGRTQVAAVGPVVAEALERIGVTAIEPDVSFHLKPLIRAIAAAFEKASPPETSAVPPSPG